MIAWNPLAAALLGLINLARRRFLARDQVLTTGHEEFGEIAVARLRAAADRYPRDVRLSALLAEQHGIQRDPGDASGARPGHRTKTMVHPELDPLRTNCDVLTGPEDDRSHDRRPGHADGPRPAVSPAPDTRIRMIAA